MKRLIAIALCMLMLTTLSACTTTQDHNQSTDPSTGNVSVVPETKDATGSVFIGTWNVSAKSSVMEKITFYENGTLRINFGTSQLGGVFFDEDPTVSLYISQKLAKGTYTVDGDVITIITEDDVLVLTKA